MIGETLNRIDLIFFDLHYAALPSRQHTTLYHMELVLLQGLIYILFQNTILLPDNTSALTISIVALGYQMN